MGFPSHPTMGTADGQAYVFGPGSAAWTTLLMRNMPECHGSQKTVIVLGMPGGGTSATAAVLDAIGVTMGDPHDLRQGGGFENQAMMDPSRQEETVVKYNATHDVWGWKNPKGVAMLAGLPVSTRNPYCVFVFRDPIVGAWHFMRTQNVSCEEGLDLYHTEHQLLYTAMRECKYPSLLLSYERLKTNPEFFIRALVDFLDIIPTPDQWVNAIGRVSNRGGYIVMPKEFGPGRGNVPYNGAISYEEPD